MQLSESTHRQTFIDSLAEAIRQKANDDSLAFHTAATRVLLRWLGYELDDENFIDARDRGIDAWLDTESGIDIFQVKTHEADGTGILNLSPFDGQGVHDLERAKIFLMHERDGNVQNKKLKYLLRQWYSAISSRRLEGSSIAMPVTLHLVILG